MNKQAVVVLEGDAEEGEGDLLRDLSPVGAAVWAGSAEAHK